MSARSLRPAACGALLVLLSIVTLHRQTTAQSVAAAPDVAKYLTPSPQIVATFDAPPLPQVTVSPTREVLALTLRKGSPGLAELARPTLRLAAVGVVPKY